MDDPMDEMSKNSLLETRLTPVNTHGLSADRQITCFSISSFCVAPSAFSIEHSPVSISSSKFATFISHENFS